MSEPQAPRMRRPSWRDPRLGVGVLLVVASVVLGSWVVARADATVEVYQAEAALTPGEPISVEDLIVVQVRMDNVASVYLVPGSGRIEGAVVARTIAAGELVPLAALGSAEDIAVRPVQISMSAALADAVEPGSAVDLWVALPDPGQPQGALLPPERLVNAVEVRDVYEETSVFAGSGDVQIQVLVPESDLADVLAAISAEGQILVIPILGGSAST